MSALMSWRVWAAVALAIALAASHWKAYVLGGQEARAELSEEHAAQARDMLQASEHARAKEQELQTKVRKVTNDYAIQKQARVADAVRTADRLREYQAALAAASTPADPATTGGADATIGRIAGECAAALGALDTRAREYRDIAQGLQEYAGSVCVSAPGQ